MGKIGRFACIFTPMAMTVASLICLVFVWVGNTGTGSTQASLYFFKTDMSKFNANPFGIAGTDIDTQLLDGLKASSQTGDLKDYYQVGLWNYCSGDIDPDTGAQTLTFCSEREKSYWFNPVEVWQLRNEAVQNANDGKLDDALHAYQKVVGWVFTAYAVAFFATLAEILIGFLALFSRWGSLATTIVSSVSSAFVFGASVSATVIYAAMVGAFHSVLEPYHINASLGGRMLAATWLATAFSLGAGVFWLLSVCCCSGKSDSPAHRGSAHKGTVVEKTPYTYERVASPLMPAAKPSPTQPSTEYAGPYEPFRHAK